MGTHAIQLCKCGRGDAIYHNGPGSKLTHSDFEQMPSDIKEKALRGIDVCKECRADVNAWWLGKNKGEKWHVPLVYGDLIPHLEEGEN